MKKKLTEMNEEELQEYIALQYRKAEFLESGSKRFMVLSRKVKRAKRYLLKLDRRKLRLVDETP